METQLIFAPTIPPDELLKLIISVLGKDHKISKLLTECLEAEDPEGFIEALRTLSYCTEEELDTLEEVTNQFYNADPVKYFVYLRSPSRLLH